MGLGRTYRWIVVLLLLSNAASAQRMLVNGWRHASGGGACSTTTLYTATFNPVNGSPAYSASWGTTANALRRRGEATIQGDNTTRVSTTFGTTFPRTLAVLQFTYEDNPLEAQTISGTFSAQFLASVSGTGSAYPVVIVKVMSSDYSVTRGELVNTSGSNYGTVVSSTTYTNRSFAVDIAMNPVVCQAGDVIVVEIGGRAVSGSSGTTFRIRYTSSLATPELAVDNSTTSEHVSWFKICDPEGVQFQ